MSISTLATQVYSESWFQTLCGFGWVHGRTLKCDDKLVAKGFGKGEKENYGFTWSSSESSSESSLAEGSSSESVSSPLSSLSPTAIPPPATDAVVDAVGVAVVLAVTAAVLLMRVTFRWRDGSSLRAWCMACARRGNSVLSWTKRV